MVLSGSASSCALRRCFGRSITAKTTGEMPMATLLRAGLAALALSLIQTAAAQDYPARQVRLIVPFGAGGPADVYARVIAQPLSEEMKQTFIVENRPGA